MSDSYYEHLFGVRDKVALVTGGTRGIGLMIGIELASDMASRTAHIAQDKGLLINATQGNVIRFMPPMIVSEGNIDRAISILDESLQETVFLNSKAELVDHLSGPLLNATLENTALKYYGFDERINWNTFIVLVDNHPVGFTDKDFEP